MSLGPPRPTSSGSLRHYCDRCGEHWTEDNIDECVSCQRDVCCSCGGSYSLEGRRPREWWCDRCRERSGLADVEWVPNPDWRPKQHTPKTLSILNLKASVLRDRNSTFLEWPPDEQRRTILTESLQVLKFNVETNGKDFEVAPKEMPVTDGLLVFSKRGIKRLVRVVGEMQELAISPSGDGPVIRRVQRL